MKAGYSVNSICWLGNIKYWNVESGAAELRLCYEPVNGTKDMKGYVELVLLAMIDRFVAYIMST